MADTNGLPPPSPCCKMSAVTPTEFICYRVAGKFQPRDGALAGFHKRHRRLIFEYLSGFIKWQLITALMQQTHFQRGLWHRCLWHFPRRHGERIY